MSDLKYSILEKYGTLSTARNGSTLELRKVSWFGKPAKFDLRNWEGDELAKASGKMTLTEEEVYNLYLILSKMYGNRNIEVEQDINSGEPTPTENITPFGNSTPPPPPTETIHYGLDGVDLDLGSIITDSETKWD